MKQITSERKRSKDKIKDKKGSPGSESDVEEESESEEERPSEFFRQPQPEKYNSLVPVIDFMRSADKSTKAILSHRSKLNCNHIIAAFLVHTSAWMSDDFFAEVFLLMALFRKALEERGEHFVNYGKKDFLDAKSDIMMVPEYFCEGSHIEVSCKISNSFLTEALNDYLKNCVYR